MTDVELLAALAADNFELILEGSKFPPGTNGPGQTPQTTLYTGQGSEEERRENARMLEQGPPPPAPLHPPTASSHQPAPGARQTATATEDGQTGRSKPRTAGQGQPHTARQLQPETADQTPASTPQAQLPTAQPGALNNGKKTRKTKNKAINCYWPKVFCRGE
jgi:hypothetical protein